MKLRNIMRRAKHSGRYGSGRRFYSSRDMAEIKHDEAKKNSRIKRGEEKARGNNKIVVCGCGTEGCFLHIGFDNKDSHVSGNTEKI